jgi:uncharacterized protein (TIGR03118 family)
MRVSTLICTALVCAAGLASLRAATPANAYYQHNLVADTAGVADFTDPNLINPWGIATSATSPFWVNDGGTGLSTVYSSTGSVLSVKAIVPPSAAGKSPSTATGIVFNGTGGFAIAPGHAPSFIFTTADGTISGWASAVDATHAMLMVDNSSSGAIYYGLAISGTSSSGPGPYLYAPNFYSGAIDVFDTNYKPVTLAGSFADPKVPSGYAPFNIWNLGGKLYVAYAKQNAAKNFSQAGAGNGYVAVFDLNGNLLQHLISGGQLNAPWGVAIAPATFGAFANALLVGNFGDGTINAFDPATGNYLGTLQDGSGNNIHIDGLWGLIVGNGGNGGDPNAVYFAAGVGNQQHGLFGSLQAAPVVSSSAIGNAADGTAIIAPNTWVSIYGASLAATTRGWTTKDFVNGALPTSLDGVSVMVNGKPAYVGYVSPKQLNVLTPVEVAPGAPVAVQVTSNGLIGSAASVPDMPYSPACFFFKGGPYVAALHSDNVTPVGPTTLFANSSTPAKPGETIVIYATGFGDTNPAVPSGAVATGKLPLATTPVVTIGGITAQVAFAGVTAPGLYQFNVTVPQNVPDGDADVLISVGAFMTPGGGKIAVQH